jgi:hypothetical protein
LAEAAGVEPTPPQNANWLVAHDFRRNSLETRCLVVNSLCSGVLLGAIVETAWERPPLPSQSPEIASGSTSEHFGGEVCAFDPFFLDDIGLPG